MKKTILLPLLALLLSLCLPLPVRSAPPSRVSIAAAAPLPAAPEKGAASSSVLLPETILLLADGETLELPLEDYLCGVVAAEMPASFPPEALKAQAVAARSFTCSGASAHKHGEAAVCADPGCCQAWLGEEALRARWGGDYETNALRIRAAVEATAGQILCYAGAPVFAAFHSSSAGATEDCGAVWNPRPYLVSVSSPETAEDVPQYISTVSCWPTDFRDTLLSLRPEADFSGPVSGWIGEIRRDASGRVDEAELGGVSFRGTELRRLFSLRSTAFELKLADGVFVFTVTGFGHGVGMSQYGAKVLAEQGADYAEILAHYYTGTELVSCT
ncbi:MAG: stage II sporulation protein D [Clostridia bacterium]